MMSCAPKALREAEEVVAQADSLRAAGQMYGIDAGDSATLAQAYETLGSLSLFNFHFSPSYAHACYHYGRLLREKDNPVEAMHCFINATHACTRDYHILGRVYSNMGDIAHLAGEFPLAYDMYERSGQMYLHNGDSLLYYYDLYNMAFELAEQGKKEKVYKLIHIIENHTDDKNLLTLAFAPKAIACKNEAQYDSMLYYTGLALEYQQYEPCILLCRAQAYSFLGQKDSAIFYAQQVTTQSESLFELNNALYILTNDDNSKDIAAVREVAAERSDTQKLLEIRQGKLSQAVQLLEQDLHRKPDLAWLYAICATLAIVGLVVFIYVHKKRRQRALLSQQIEDLTVQNKEAAVQHAQIIQKQAQHREALVSHFETMCDMFANADNFPNNLIWKDYSAMCRIINDNFGMLAMKLQSIYQLPERGIRLCILVLMKVSDSKELASLLFYSESGIRNFKNRVAKKLGTNSVELRNTLINIAINN